MVAELNTRMEKEHAADRPNNLPLKKTKIQQNARMKQQLHTYLCTAKGEAPLHHWFRSLLHRLTMAVLVWF